MRRALPAVVFLLVLVIAWWVWPRAEAEHVSKSTSSRPPLPRKSAAVQGAAPPAAAAVGSLEEEFPIVAPLNQPNSTIGRDLDTLSQVLDAWRTSFPRDGNPVGENAEITAALAGENSLGLVLIPKTHPAINARGELCDRWGTPFRFHQLSGQHMEIRSAGPDRKFATADDAIWHPSPP